MTHTQTAALVSLLNTWMSGSSLLDDLIPQTQSLIAQLTAPTKRTKAAADCRAVDTSGMTDAQLRAYYKKIAPVEDVRFHLRRELSADLRAGYESLLATLEAGGGKATAQTKAEYRRLQQLERERNEWAERSRRHAIHARLRRMQARHREAA